MAGSGSFELHEEGLTPETTDQHRAIVSIMEELEAVDWYSQRVEAATDDELRAVLAHNRDEELEHAAMVIEWLRRHNATFAAQLKTYLWSEGPIIQVEAQAEAEELGVARDGGGAVAGTDVAGSLGIGSLKEGTV